MADVIRSAIWFLHPDALRPSHSTVLFAISRGKPDTSRNQDP
jgi:hypothetical protein